MITVLIVVAGITGTALMTAFVYLVSQITGKQLKVIHVLGTMLTGQTTPGKNISSNPSAFMIGIAVHYLVGILFAFIYHWLWSIGLGRPDILNGLLFGFINGFIASAGWRFFFAIHQNPPLIDLKNFLLVIFLAHIVFGIGVVLAYNVFQHFLY